MTTATDTLSVLIVDDEQPVRRTFQEWLTEANLDCAIYAAADAEAALRQANAHPIDLAILDWNLGAGHDGLRLLEDLYVFQPDIAAILVTGYAHQATPLDAMRMGVRDYLDKNQELDRDVFVKAVKKQLDRIRPVKRERELHQSLLRFRQTLNQALPLVRSAAAWNEPAALPEAVRTIVEFLIHQTSARDGVLLLRNIQADGAPQDGRVYDRAGRALDVVPIAFNRSIAAGAVSLGRPAAMANLRTDAIGVELQPFERDRRSILAVPVSAGPQTQVVVELFDKLDARGAIDASGFSSSDEHSAAQAIPLAAGLLGQAVAEKQTRDLLVEAVSAALDEAERLGRSLGPAESGTASEDPPQLVLDEVRRSLEQAGEDPLSTPAVIQLLEAVRALARRHGPAAIEHCTKLANDLRQLLDRQAGGTAGP
jgi:DNA-binding NarL/FixJ family response regulator